MAEIADDFAIEGEDIPLGIEHHKSAADELFEDQHAFLTGTSVQLARPPTRLPP